MFLDDLFKWALLLVKLYNEDIRGLLIKAVLELLLTLNQQFWLLTNIKSWFNYYIHFKFFIIIHIEFKTMCRQNV
jgi:hypothetical protein